MSRQPQAPLSLIAAVLIATLGAAGCARRPSAEDAAPPRGGQAAAVSARSCRNDQDCAGGFCDRGVCQTPIGIYGRPCKPAPRTPEGPRDGMHSVCGAYLCLDGRCRSCQSDEQCRSELGSPRCYKLEGEPGYRCGNPSQ